MNFFLFIAVFISLGLTSYLFYLLKCNFKKKFPFVEIRQAEAGLFLCLACSIVALTYFSFLLLASLGFNLAGIDFLFFRFDRSNSNALVDSFEEKQINLHENQAKDDKTPLSGQEIVSAASKGWTGKSIWDVGMGGIPDNSYAFVRAKEFAESISSVDLLADAMAQREFGDEFEFQKINGYLYLIIYARAGQLAPSKDGSFNFYAFPREQKEVNYLAAVPINSITRAESLNIEPNGSNRLWVLYIDAREIRTGNITSHR